jgi:pre-mRNA-splicing factor CDC5/CEF1
MVQLMQHDSIAHPLPGTSLPGRTELQYAIPPADDIAVTLSESHLKLAQSLGFSDAGAHIAWYHHSSQMSSLLDT